MSQNSSTKLNFMLHKLLLFFFSFIPLESSRRCSKNYQLNYFYYTTDRRSSLESIFIPRKIISFPSPLTKQFLFYFFFVSRNLRRFSFDRFSVSLMCYNSNTFGATLGTYNLFSVILFFVLISSAPGRFNIINSYHLTSQNLH